MSSSNINQLLRLKADSKDVYTKRNTDALLATKANIRDVYERSYIDEKFRSIPNPRDFYDKKVLDSMLKYKVDTKDVYTKRQIDTLIKNGSGDGVTKIELIRELKTKADAKDVIDEKEFERGMALKADKSTTYTKNEIDFQIDQALNNFERNKITIHLNNKLDKKDAYTRDEVDKTFMKKSEAVGYTKPETDDLLAKKIDKTDTYNKSQLDYKLSGKLDKALAYTKDQLDVSLSKKADKSTTYTREYTDTNFLNKVTGGVVKGLITAENHINLSGTRLQNVGEPTELTDGVTKDYVDRRHLFKVESDVTPQQGELIFMKYYSDTNEIRVTNKNDKNVNWVKGFGGTGDDIPVDMTIDSSGNVYVAGYFQTDINLGADILGREVILTNNEDNKLYLIKYNQLGGLIWAKSLGVLDTQTVAGLAVDSDDNLYLVGSFESSIILGRDFTNNDVILTNQGNYRDGFIAKYSSDGFVIKSIKINSGDTGDIDVKNIRIDTSSNDLYLYGRFDNTASFGTNVDSLPVTLSGATGNDVFVAKYINDRISWAITFKATTSIETTAFQIDNLNNIIIVGNYAGQLQYNTSQTNNSNGDNDIFIIKYDSDGDFSWFKSIGSSNGDNTGGVSIDSQNNIYITGQFNGTVNFGTDINNDTITKTNTNTNMFVAKYSSNGILSFVKTVNNTTNNTSMGNDIILDSNNNFYVTGQYEGNVQFGLDINGSIVSETVIGHSDIFIVKYASSGIVDWIKTFGSSYGDNGLLLSIDDTNNLFVSGVFDGTQIQFDDIYTITNTGQVDTYLIKLSSSDVESLINPLNNIPVTGFAIEIDNPNNMVTVEFPAKIINKLSGLTTGSFYYYNAAFTDLVTTQTNNIAGLALSTTKLLMLGTGSGSSGGGGGSNIAQGDPLTISNGTQSTSNTTGALIVEGGVGIGKNVNIGGIMNVDDDTTFEQDVIVKGNLVVNGVTSTQSVAAIEPTLTDDSSTLATTHFVKSNLARHYTIPAFVLYAIPTTYEYCDTGHAGNKFHVFSQDVQINEVLITHQHANNTHTIDVKLIWYKTSESFSVQHTQTNLAVALNIGNNTIGYGNKVIYGSPIDIDVGDRVAIQVQSTSAININAQIYSTIYLRNG